LNPSPKQYAVDNSSVLQLNSPGSFVTIPGIGSTGNVTQAVTFYARTTIPMLLQLTFANPGGGSDIVSQIPINGVMLAEYPANGYLKLVQVQGAGQFEWWASGLQLSGL